MNRSIEVVNQLKSYFGAVVIGSQLFVDNNLLSEEDTNDIDVMVNNAKRTSVMDFLRDAGFKTSDNVRFISASHDKPIDVFAYNADHPLTLGAHIAYKFNRGYTDDLRQLAMVVFNKGKGGVKSIRELQEFYNDANS